MINHDILHKDGKPYVIIPLMEYYTLQRNTQGGKDINLPEDIIAEIALGRQHPVKIIRLYRGMKQGDLAKAAGLSRPYLAEIEAGRKRGSASFLKQIADALDVDMDLIVTQNTQR